jgi:hypothetical protein
MKWDQAKREDEKREEKVGLSCSVCLVLSCCLMPCLILCCRCGSRVAGLEETQTDNETRGKDQETVRRMEGLGLKFSLALTRG